MARLPSVHLSYRAANRPLPRTVMGQFSSRSFLTFATAALPIRLNELKFGSYDERFLARHFMFFSFPNAGSQELKNNRYYILCLSDKTFGKESSNLEIKSLLKAILQPRQSDTL